MHAEIIEFTPSLAAAAPQRRLSPLPRPAAPARDDRLAGVGPGWFLVLSRRRPETLGAVGQVTGPRDAAMWLYLVEPRDRVVRPVTGIATTEPHRLLAWSSDGRRALLECPFGDETLVTEVDLRSGAPLNRVVVGDSASVSYAFPSELALLVDDSGDLRVVYLNGSRDIVFADDLPLVHHRRPDQPGAARPAAQVREAVSRLFPLDIHVSAVAHPAGAG